MPRHWVGLEVTAACKVYAKSTLNPLLGADQDLEKYFLEVVQRMEEFVPPNAKPGMFHHLGTRVYIYIHDNIFRKLQKFDKAL